MINTLLVVLYVLVIVRLGVMSGCHAQKTVCLWLPGFFGNTVQCKYSQSFCTTKACRQQGPTGVGCIHFSKHNGAFSPNRYTCMNAWVSPGHENLSTAMPPKLTTVQMAYFIDLQYYQNPFHIMLPFMTQQFHPLWRVSSTFSSALCKINCELRRREMCCRQSGLDITCCLLFGLHLISKSLLT